MNHLNIAPTLTAVIGLSLAGWAQASLLADDFETDLSGWVERNPALPTGQIVVDPLDAFNQVLSFQRVGSNGTMHSTTTVDSPSGIFVLSFDYLGVAPSGPAPTYSGGYIAVVRGVDLPGAWIGGSGSYPVSLQLVDDGTWHSYSYTFTSGWGNSLMVKVQDWGGAGAIAGDAFFDNISLQAVPEPTTIALTGLALLVMGASTKRASSKRV